MIADTLVSSRLNLSAEHLTSCLLCEHRCGVNRLAGQQGPCKAGPEARVFRHRVEYGEEIELIPSHLFYLSGCDLRCSFCIAEANAFNPSMGTALTPEFFTEAVSFGQSQGAKNIQWVGGEPTIHIPAILQTMAGCDELPPIVWKSDFYGTPVAFSLLDGVVDIYVADFKFGNNECAQRIASVPRYIETVTRNLKIASQQGDLIVRHLLLPGHFDCCYRAVVQWMAEELPMTKFSLRDGYLPRWQAQRHVELRKPIDSKSVKQAVDFALHHNLNLIN